MRCSEVILVDDVVDALAFVVADVLEIRILQFLVMLYREILPLDDLFEFFADLSGFFRFLQTTFQLYRIVSVHGQIGF